MSVQPNIRKSRQVGQSSDVMSASGLSMNGIVALNFAIRMPSARQPRLCFLVAFEGLSKGPRTARIGADCLRFWRTVAQTRKGLWCLGSGSEGRANACLQLVWRNFGVLVVPRTSDKYFAAYPDGRSARRRILSWTRMTAPSHCR